MFQTTTINHPENDNHGSCGRTIDSSSSTKKCQCSNNNNNSNNNFNAKNLVKLSSNYAKLKQTSYTAYNKSLQFNLSLIVIVIGWCLLQTFAVIQGAAVYTSM